MTAPPSGGTGRAGAGRADAGPPGPDDGSPALRSGFVALLGRPNVGKSSLCNRLVGEKVAITSPVPQTTRRRIRGVLHLPGAQVVFVDTPGLHRPQHLLGRAMMREATSALEGADVACLVVDASAPAPGEGDRRAALHVARAGCPRLLVLNKCDLVPPAELSGRREAYRALAGDGPPFTAVLAVSARTGAGCAELVAAVVDLLPPGPAYFPPDVQTDQPERVLAAELVREQALHLLRDEVPHAVAVVVEEWKERPGGLVYVGATLYVERESQKGIVIGSGGSMLRAIGSAAREELERRLATRVYLDIRVKVREDWRRRAGSVQALGLGPE